MSIWVVVMMRLYQSSCLLQGIQKASVYTTKRVSACEARFLTLCLVSSCRNSFYRILVFKTSLLLFLEVVIGSRKSKFSDTLAIDPHLSCYYFIFAVKVNSAGSAWHKLEVGANNLFFLCYEKLIL